MLVFTATAGLFLNYTDSQSLKPTKQCDIDLTQECVEFNNNQQVSVRFLQKIEVEEELLLSISVPENTKITNMWVQGINMYMGKSAVLTDSVYAQNGKKVYNARLFLGACSEPKMRWQLIIQTLSSGKDNNNGNVKNAFQENTKKEHSWFFNFSTDRNKKS